MAYKAALFVGNERRDLKTFHINYFQGRNSTVTNWSDTTNFGTIDSLREFVKADRHAFRVQEGQPYGGLLEMTFESTDDDDFFYDWFIPSKNHGTSIKNGIIEFYDNEDEIPFKKIEFWDGWITNIAEDMCSTGSSPMTVRMRISPATIRYDKLIVIQKSWWQTDINSKGGDKAEDEDEKLKVQDVYWMEKNSEKKMYIDYPDYPVTLYIETINYNEGETVTIKMKWKDGEKLANGKHEMIISAKVDADGLAVIDNFNMN